MAKYKLKRDPAPKPEEPPEPQNSLIQTGILTEWNDDRGYGFITPDKGGRKVFLHATAVPRSIRRPVLGDHFYYLPTMDERGSRAIEAFQMDNTMKRPPRQPRPQQAMTLMYAFAHCWLLGPLVPFSLAVYARSCVFGFVMAYLVNSSLTFAFYQDDLSRAKNNQLRIREKHLHLWELFCGWPGALLAQQIFRHKIRKSHYRHILIAACAIDMLLLIVCFGIAGIERTDYFLTGINNYFRVEVLHLRKLPNRLKSSQRSASWHAPR